MIKVLLLDFSRTLLFPKDAEYKGDLNPLHKELSQKGGYNFSNYFELNNDLLKFLKGLKDKYKIYIFTSGSIQNVSEIKEKLDEVFDGIFSSEETGFSKKVPEAYEHLAEKLNVKPQEILFIDDSEANIEVARSVGYWILRYQTNEKIMGEINKLLKY